MSLVGGRWKPRANRHHKTTDDAPASAAGETAHVEHLDLRDAPIGGDVNKTGHGVLVVDDEADIRELVRVVLSTSDLAISVIENAVDGAAALDALPLLRRQCESVVVVLDKQLPDLDGLDVAKAMLERDPTELIVLFTAYLTDDVSQQAGRLGIKSCVTKSRLQMLPAVISVLLSGPQATTKAVGSQPNS